jgi:hypothetical protein
MSIDQFLLSADTTDLNYPEIRPTLDLNFARVKALDPRITFTRASGGSYVGADGLIKYAGVNEARFDHDPVTGESLGLLIEEARVNRTTSSNYSIVSLSRVIINTSVQDVAPDGSTLSAFQATDDTSGPHRINLSNGNTGNATVPHTASFFIKIPDNQPTTSDLIRTLVRWRSSSGSGAGAFILYDRITKKYSTATINAFGTNPPTNYNHTQISFIDYPNGWKRVTIPNVVASSDSATTYGLYDWNISSEGAEAAGNCIVFLWGAQFEAGTFPTSYIPTQASTRTRAADNASITGKNFSSWYRQDEGSMVLFGMKHNMALGNFKMPYDLSDGSASNEIHVALNSGNYTVYSAILNNSIVRRTDFSPGGKVLRTFLAGDPFSSSATSWKPGELVTSFRGDLAIIRLDINIPYVSRLDIGRRVNNTLIYIGTISRLTYFPKRLPNAQLQALTR